ncbi:M48 family metalloprotease, partial [Porticoccus sp.]
MLRIGLFLATNIAILVLFSIVFRVLGLEHYLATQGIHTNLGGLLIMCGFFGFAGSFFSLLISKWMAKKSSGIQLITQPRTPEERWLVETVSDLAKKAGIGMPEVGIFPAQQSNAFATGWNKNNALVAVSAGLLHRFDREEARAVLAHEIGHVANGDMITLSL